MHVRREKREDAEELPHRMRLLTSLSSILSSCPKPTGEPEEYQREEGGVGKGDGRFRRRTFRRWHRVQNGGASHQHRSIVRSFPCFVDPQFIRDCGDGDRLRKIVCTADRHSFWKEADTHHNRIASRLFRKKVNLIVLVNAEQRLRFAVCYRCQEDSFCRAMQQHRLAACFLRAIEQISDSDRTFRSLPL